MTLNAVRVHNKNGGLEDSLSSDEDVFVEIDFDLPETISSLRVGVSMLNSEGTLLFLSSDFAAASQGKSRSPGRHVSRVRIPGSMLIAGRYSFEVHVELPRIQTLIEGIICNFQIDEMAHDNWGPMLETRTPGIIHPGLEWETERVSD